VFHHQNLVYCDLSICSHLALMNKFTSGNFIAVCCGMRNTDVEKFMF
jgi:hypothetical protein